MSRRSIHNQKGVSLVLLALSIVVLFGFGALAIDIGHLYHVKDQLQVAADAAALAAASELIDNPSNVAQTDARDMAHNIAFQNTADVASVPDIPNAPEGAPIPVFLDLNTGNDATGDIVVGNWNENTMVFTPANGMLDINAVKVVARRTDARAEQPRASNWFARVFTLLGKVAPANFDFTAISATAIAAKVPVPLLPIAVNEYWDEDPKDSQHNPYGQVYPESFMRSVNVDPTHTPARGGQIFAILGARAESNQTSMDLNSFVNILLRNRFHDGRATDTPSAWWIIRQDTTTGSCTPTCDNNLTALNAGEKPGDVNNAKHDEVYQWLFTGIPANIIPPNAVREVQRYAEAYAADNYKSDPPYSNDPSKCPYASIAYFSSGGNTDQPLGPNGIRFSEKWPRGPTSRFMVMVYDGTHTTIADPNQANVVTVVGYGIIEIDGYSSAPISGTPFDGNKGTLGPAGNTAYGHALKHGIAGLEDEYLIQPSDSDHTPDCSFIDLLNQARSNLATVRLVHAVGVKYGTSD